MKIRTYLNFDGNCEEAIELYKQAFNAEANPVARFSDMPPNPNFVIPEEFKNRILQCELHVGDDFLRMSDCGPMNPINSADTEKLALCFEGTVEQIQQAFDVLSREGKVGMPLEKTFFSPSHGMVYDKFGIMWSLVAQ